MKSFSRLFISAIALVAMSSCTKELEAPKANPSQSESITLEATFAGHNNTKTSLDSETGKMYWMPDDEIGVFYGKYLVDFVSLNEEPSPTAMFLSLGMLVSGTVEGGSGTSDVVMRAVYPFNDDAECINGIIYTTLPSEQNAVAGTFDNNLFISVAETTASENKLAFYNVCSGVRFKVNRSGINKVVISGNNHEALAGNIGISIDDNSIPTVSSITEPAEEIVLTCEDGFKEGEWYYAVTLPGALASGFTVSMYLDDFYIDKYVNESNLTMSRGVFGSISELQIPDWIDNTLFYKTSDNTALSVDLPGISSNTYENGNGIITFQTPLTDIGQEAFYGCNNLTEIAIPSTVTRIGYSAFFQCYNLSNVIIPSSVTAIDSGAFMDCTSLTEIVIPNSVEYLGSYVFDFCTNLEKIVLPDNIKYIPSQTFASCQSLSSITIPNSVEYIYNSAFQGCGSLTRITIPNSVKEIGSNAFANSYLDEITIPNSVTRIGAQAFRKTQLWSITIPDSVTDIDASIIEECSNLWEVFCPESIEAKLSYSGCNNLRYINNKELVYDKGFIIKDNCVIGLNGNYSYYDLTIPDGITSIGTSAFKNGKIYNVSIPDSVSEIGDNAFSYCENLQTITLPNNITNIGNYTFEGCSNLTSITIPDNVTSIGDYTFSYCSNLTSITIPDNVTTIGKYAFYNCRKLSSIAIPDNVTSIGELAFCHCSNLADISLPEGITTINRNSFTNCNSLTDITIPSTVTKIDANVFDRCYSLTCITVLATTPPETNNRSLTGTSFQTIKVPAESVEAYKSADYWSDFASIITAIE